MTNLDSYDIVTKKDFYERVIHLENAVDYAVVYLKHSNPRYKKELCDIT